MAPEPAVLKRQRSRPSEWWAAPPTSAPVAAMPPARFEEEHQYSTAKKKEERVSVSGISEAPAAGNGGIVKGKVGVGSKASRGLSSGGKPEPRILSLEAERSSEKIKKRNRKMQGAPGKEKPLRRGRSSGGEAKLRALGESYQNTEDPTAKKRPKLMAGSVDDTVDELAPKREVKLTAAQRKEKAGQGKSEEVVRVRERQGRTTVTRTEDESDELVDEGSGKTAVSKKRGGKAVEQADELNEDELEEPVAPKKRGRPTAAHPEKQADELNEEPEEVVPRKNRRQPAVQVEKEVKEIQPKASKKRERAAIMEVAVDPEAEKPATKKRHKHLSEAEILEQHSARFAVADSPVRKRSRLRPSDIVTESSKSNDQGRNRKRSRQSEFQSSNISGVETGDRGRRRISRSDAVFEQAILEPPNKSTRKIAKSNGRSEVIEVEAASSKLTHKRADKRPRTTTTSAIVANTAGRVSSSTQASHKSKKGGQSSKRTIVQQAVPEPSQARKKSSDRPTQIEGPSQKRKAANNPEPDPPNYQRGETAHEQERSNELEDAPASYQHLKAVTRRISRQTIDAKWEPLQMNSIDRIIQLLQDAQRPVLARIHDEKKKTQASTALQSTARNLTKKLIKGLPFPPGTRSHTEDDFDFEKVLDHSRALEAQLTPTMHSNALLTAELRKEMALLESDKGKLAELEVNARGEAAARSKAARKFHSLLQSDDPLSKVEELNNNIGLDITRQSKPSDLGLHDDENLQALVKELDGHVGTIQGNIQQIAGISQAMAKSRAAVEATLFQHLDNSKYYEVILGPEE